MKGGRPLLLVGVGLAAVLAVAGLPVRAAAPKAQDRNPVFSPDGKELAFVRWGGTGGRVMVVRSDGTGLRAVTKAPQPYGLSWSPDEKALAYSSGGEIWVVSLDGTAPVDITNTTDAQESEAAWSPDGSRIAFVSFEGCFRCTKVYVADPNGSNKQAVADDARRPAWSPDGTRIVLASPGAAMRIFDLDAGGPPESLVPGSFPAWSPDGRQIAFLGPPGVRVYDTGAHTTRLVARKLGAFPAWSPDGRRLAASAGPGKLGIVYPSGKGLKVIAGADLANDAPSWSKAGLLAFVERGRCGIDVVRADGSQRRRLTHAC